METDSDPLHDDETRNECNRLRKCSEAATLLRPDGKDLRIRRRFLVSCPRGTIAIVLIKLSFVFQ